MARQERERGLKEAAAQTQEGVKGAILAKATELFANLGYEGTSVRDIVNALGVNVSLISYYFGSKDGLYRACLERAGERRLELTQTHLKPPATRDDFLRSLAAFIEKSLGASAPDLAAQRLVASEADRGRDTFDDLQYAFVKSHSLTAAFFEAAAAHGLIRSDLHPQALASMLRALIVNEARLEPLKSRLYGLSVLDTEHREICAKQIFKLFVGGVLEEERGDKPKIF